MNSFIANLANELGVPHNGAWLPGVMNDAEAVAAMSRLNGCSEQLALQLINTLKPYTNDPSCNSMFYGAVATTSGATNVGDVINLGNACFIDLQNPANNSWSFADISDDLSAVYCNGLVVGLIGIAPAGLDLNMYAQSVVPNIPHQLYGFMGFTVLLAEGENGKVDITIGLVDASGTDLEWYEFDTVQTAYLVLKGLFINNGIFGSIYYRAAMYGKIMLDGVLYENNDKIAEVLLKYVDVDAGGVVDVTPAVEHEPEPTEFEDASPPESEVVESGEFDEGGFDEGGFDEFPTESGEEIPSDTEFATIPTESEEEISSDTEFDVIPTESGEEIPTDTEFDAFPIENGFGELPSNAEFEEAPSDTEFEEAPSDTEFEEAPSDTEFDEVPSDTESYVFPTYSPLVEQPQGMESEESSSEFTFEDAVGLESAAVQKETAAEGTQTLASSELVESTSEDSNVALGRDDLVAVLRQVVGASNVLITMIIGEPTKALINSETLVSVYAVCHVMRDENYPEETIQSFVLLANRYVIDDKLKCSEAIQAISKAVWGDVPEYSRKSALNHAAGLLYRNRDALWLGVYYTTAIIERLKNLGYKEDVCSRVAKLMQETRDDAPNMLKKMIGA